MNRDSRDPDADPSAPLLVNDVARLAADSDDHVSSETIRHWARTGILRSVKTPGGVHVFERRDVTEFLRNRATLRRERERVEKSTAAPSPEAA